MEIGVAILEALFCLAVFCLFVFVTIRWFKDRGE